MFFAELAFGRNFLWRKELIPHFSHHYLLENIWNTKLLFNYDEIRAAFIKIAMSLYIDHDPLNRVAVPQACRIFKNAGVYNKDEIRVYNYFPLSFLKKCLC